jgi:hypothetical protein
MSRQESLAQSSIAQRIVEYLIVAWGPWQVLVAYQILNHTGKYLQDCKMNHQSFHPDNWNDTWLKDRQPSSTATQRPPSSFHDEFNNPQHDYEKRLSLLPYDICGDVLEGWIGIIEPEINYSGTEIPTWWPEAITFMRPRVMLKRGK